MFRTRRSSASADGWTSSSLRRPESFRRKPHLRGQPNRAVAVLWGRWRSGQCLDPAIVGFGDWLDFKFSSPARIFPAKTASTRSTKAGSCCPMGTMALRECLGPRHRRLRRTGWTSSFSSPARTSPAKTASTRSTKAGSCCPMGTMPLRQCFGPGDRRLRRLAATSSFSSPARISPAKTASTLSTKAGSCCPMGTMALPAMSRPR